MERYEGRHRAQRVAVASVGFVLSVLAGVLVGLALAVAAAAVRGWLR